MLFIPQIANQIYKILDTTMIGWLVTDKTETGYYEQGHKVIRLLLTIVNSLGVVMIPRMANAFANNDKKQINAYMKMSFNFTFFLSFPIMFGIASIAREFVPIFFGRGYDKVTYLIYLLNPMVLLMGVANVIGTQYLLPTKKQKEYTFSVTIGVIVNFILNYILITLYQSIGAAIATVLSQLVVDILQYKHIKNDISLKTLKELCYKYLVASLTMFVLCLGVKFILNISLISNAVFNFAESLSMSGQYLFNMISIVAQIGIGALTYIIMLIILKDDYVYIFINKIKNRFLKRKKHKMKDKKILAIFGGSFNPPLNSHFLLAEQIYNELENIEKVIFLPVSSKYKKNGLLSNEHRYNMLKLVIDKDEHFELSDIEMKQEEQLNTFETLELLQKDYPNNVLYFVIGTDNLKEISTWKTAEELASNFKILVLERGNDDFEKIMNNDEFLIKYKNSFILLKETIKTNLSSTLVRKNLKEGKSIKYLIPDEVLQYIKNNNLYF